MYPQCAFLIFSFLPASQVPQVTALAQWIMNELPFGADRMQDYRARMSMVASKSCLTHNRLEFREERVELCVCCPSMSVHLFSSLLLNPTHPLSLWKTQFYRECATQFEQWSFTLQLLPGNET